MDISIWKESFRIGVAQIDAQHQQLINNLEKLQRILALEDEAQCREECREVVAFLKLYTAMHFGTEEAYQQSIGFDGYERHKALHAELTAQVNERAQRLEESGYERGQVRGLAEFLEEWLVYHIVSEDKRMAPGASKHTAY